MNCIADLLKTARSAIEQQQISDSAQLDAELLLAFCLQQSRTYLYTWPEKVPSETQQACFNERLQQRLAGQPIAHLTGEREFWGLNLTVTADTLIPRPDTEILIETALNKLPSNTNNPSNQSLNITNGLSETEQACSILDLGTGTGAIALALKSERPNCDVHAVDFSLAALNVAKQNALNHQLAVNFTQSSWFEQLNPQFRFDFIVSNPPYIEEQDPHLNVGDVRFEPISALTAGKDGLEDLRIIIEQACSFLQNNGWLMVEHGYNQADKVQALFELHGYQQIETIQDYAHNPRITIGQKV